MMPYVCFLFFFFPTGHPQKENSVDEKEGISQFPVAAEACENFAMRQMLCGKIKERFAIKNTFATDATPGDKGRHKVNLLLRSHGHFYNR